MVGKGILKEYIMVRRKVMNKGDWFIVHYYQYVTGDKLCGLLTKIVILLANATDQL